MALELERQSLLERKRQLVAMERVNDRTVPAIEVPVSTGDKIALFRSLFRGRDDVHALRWENTQGRRGYALACENEWRQGICYKPKVKCGDCRHQAFLPLDDRAVYAHLSGKKTVGVYPLLRDDQTWILAVDFDKSDWQQTVRAFCRVCEEHGVPCSVERSRSGEGAHVWLFFTQPVPAVRARRLGFAILDRAMDQHAGLSFESYDRLFPNQDTLPEAGFGNLIALPLQQGPRQLGNSVFVDVHFEPFVDQWAYLAGVRKIEPEQIEQCLSRLQDPGISDYDTKPWEQGLPVSKVAITGCPNAIEVTLANRLYLPVETLPQGLLARLKRLASFSNPVFFKTQALRFSTQGIPRFISLAQIEQGFLSVPRGCMDEVLALLAEHRISVTIDDKRMSGRRLRGLQFKGRLRPEQTKAVSALAKHETGLLHAPTAFGKTVTAIGLIHKRKVNTLILVHSRQLLDQWKERLEVFLEGCDIGVIGGGKRKPSGAIDIATYQSMLDRKTNAVDPRLFDYGQIIVDECHHIAAPRYEALISEARAKYLAGITATPHRQDGHQSLIFMLAGPIRYAVKDDQRHTFEQRVIVRRVHRAPPQELSIPESRPHIADIYRWLTLDDERNQLIIGDVVAAVSEGRNPLLLTERREHASLLADRLRELGVSCQVLRGAMGVKERNAAMAALDTTQVLIATGKYIGEGFDLPRLDTLFLCLPISWKGSLAQYAGRIHRQFVDKDTVRIYDYLDTTIPTLERMFGRREKAYAALGYSIADGAAQAQFQANLPLPPQ
ncbi:DEAD/DEAH box helicase [Parahaliea maris]|uniref:DEAD/DEAH box helicase n=2 Tax=Parahaliea maris TaxID=2716870 RepID=A0A5C8ZWQ4_9GAMM|nr:DEAD/DEAH box helicase [Parahaliea maris]